jgi:malonate-semialdehyde dehydrogenase (acetylating)/methylmalonate-semialdehyde dehydrogenase
MLTAVLSEGLNFVEGTRCWGSAEAYDVFDPATGEVLARIPLADGGEAEGAVQSASAAFPEWRRVPLQSRVQYLFRFKQLPEEHADEISRLTTKENGKTIAELRAARQRGIENVGVARCIPILMQG